MANLPETAQWEDGIYQLETTDPVEGGENGIDNVQAKLLANRTAYLKQQLETRTAQSTETKLGTSKAATLEQVDAGENDTAFVTSFKLQKKIASLSLGVTQEIYVNSNTGSDSSDGSQLTPFLTIKAACDHVKQGGVANINLAAGQVFDVGEGIHLLNKVVRLVGNEASRSFLRFPYSQHPFLPHASISGFALSYSDISFTHINMQLINPANINLSQSLDSGGGIITAASGGFSTMSFLWCSIALSLHASAAVVLVSVGAVAVYTYDTDITGTGYLTRNWAVSTITKALYATVYPSSILVQ